MANRYRLINLFISFFPLFLFIGRKGNEDLFFDQMFIDTRDAARVKNPGGGAGSNAARRRCPVVPSDLPKSRGQLLML